MWIAISSCFAADSIGYDITQQQPSSRFRDQVFSNQQFPCLLYIHQTSIRRKKALCTNHAICPDTTGAVYIQTTHCLFTCPTPNSEAIREQPRQTPRSLALPWKEYGKDPGEIGVLVHAAQSRVPCLNSYFIVYIQPRSINLLQLNIHTNTYSTPTTPSPPLPSPISSSLAHPSHSQSQSQSQSHIYTHSPPPHTPQTS